MCELRLPLFSALLAKCQHRRKENMGMDLAEQGLCPRHMQGCLTLVREVAVQMHKVIVVRQSVGRGSPTSSITLTPKHVLQP